MFPGPDPCNSSGRVLICSSGLQDVIQSEKQIVEEIHVTKITRSLIRRHPHISVPYTVIIPSNCLKRFEHMRISSRLKKKWFNYTRCSVFVISIQNPEGKVFLKISDSPRVSGETSSIICYPPLFYRSSLPYTRRQHPDFQTSRPQLDNERHIAIYRRTFTDSCNFNTRSAHALSFNHSRSYWFVVFVFTVRTNCYRCKWRIRSDRSFEWTILFATTGRSWSVSEFCNVIQRSSQPHRQTCFNRHIQTAVRMFLHITGSQVINETLRECAVGLEKGHVYFASPWESERVLEQCEICFHALALQQPEKLMSRGSAISVSYHSKWGRVLFRVDLDAHSFDMTGMYRLRRAPLFCSATVKYGPSVEDTHVCTRHVCFDIRWIPTRTSV